HPDSRAVEAGRLHRRRPDVRNGLAQIKLIIDDWTDSLDAWKSGDVRDPRRVDSHEDRVERLAHATQLAPAQTADLSHQPVLLLAEPFQIGPLLAGVESAALLLGIATVRDRERGVDQPYHDVDLPLGAQERGVDRGRMPASGHHQGRGVSGRSRAARGRGRDPPYSAEQGGEEE